MDKQKIKIWFLNQLAYMPEDGPHVRHYTFGKYLARMGYEPIVFASNELHGNGRRIDTGKELFCEKESEGVRFLYIKSHHYDKNDIHRAINIVFFYFDLLKACRVIERKYGAPDIIYSSCLYPTTLIAGIKLAKKYGVRCISETRDIVPDGFITEGTFKSGGIIVKMARAMMKRIYEKSDALVFTMSGGAQYLSDMGWDRLHGGKIDLKHVYYINNGVDLQAFEKNAKDYVWQDEDLSDPTLFKVVYLGAIRFMNKMPLFLDAARELKRLGRDDIKILMWGTGTKLEAMKRQLKDEGLDNLVLKGYVEKKYIPAIAKRADLFIGTGNSSSVSKYGMSFNKLFDYLAAGKPIILPFEVSNSIVAANGAGIEMKEADGKALAKEVIRFADMDKARYEEYCRNSSSLAADYSFEKLTDKVNTVIEELLEHKEEHN